MQTPRLVIFESDGRLVGQVRPLADARRWLLREASTPAAVLKLLARGGPTVLLVRVGRDLERELGLVERAAWLYPETALVVIGDSDHAPVAGLAWDLGASVVLIPAPDREILRETVAGLFLSAEAGHADAADSG